MYVIFFHVSGLALLEILFYFLYIGPMETKVFKKTIQDSVKKTINTYTNNYNIINLFNITNINNNINDYRYISKNEEKNRTQKNIQLFHNSLKYWSIILSSSIFICILEKIIIYYRKKKLNNVSEVSFEMTNLQLHNDEENIQQDNNRYYITRNIDNSSFNNEITNSIINKFKNQDYRKKIYFSIFNNILLGCLILSFEYWFFNYIILEYKIISTPEIHYLFIESINT